MTSRHLSFALLASVALALVACGGGGGGGGGTGGGGGGGVLPTIAPTAASMPVGSTIGDVRQYQVEDSYMHCYDDDDATLVEFAGRLVDLVGSAHVPDRIASDSGQVVGCAYSHSNHAFYYATGSAIYQAPIGGATTVVVSNPRVASGLTVDASGTLFYLDSNGGVSTVRNGQVNTFASNVFTDQSDGFAQSYPSIAYDPDDGNLYVASPYDKQIKRVTPAGAVALVAGHCVAGNADCIASNIPGTGAAAGFGALSGIAYAGNGTFYVADSTNNVIWTVTTAGSAQVVAGYGYPGPLDGNGLRAFFSFPQWLSYAPGTGVLYIAEANGIFNNPLYATYATHGIAQPAWTPATLRFAVPVTWSQPQNGTVAPDGSFWMSLFNGAAIAHATTSGLTQIALPSGYIQPQMLAVDPSGDVWFACQSLHPANGSPESAELVEVAPSSAMTFYTPLQQQPTFSEQIEDLTIGPDGRPWYTETDSSGSTVQTVTTGGTVVSYTITPPGIPVPPATPGPRVRNITTGPDGNLWYSFNGGIGRITTSGQILSGYALPVTPDALAKSPVDGTVWFIDGNSAIGYVTPGGSVLNGSLQISGGGASGTVGIAVDPSGNAWITESNYGVVSRVTPSFSVVRYAPPQAYPGLFGIGVRTDGKVWYSGVEGAAYLLDPAAYDAAGLPH